MGEINHVHVTLAYVLFLYFSLISKAIQIPLAMSNPVQVDVPFLDRLIRLGSSACQGLKVYGDSESKGADKAHCAASGPAAPSSTTTTETSKQGEVKKGFEPQRKYYMEGRIIHKRKLSRRLFFLDVSLVRRRHKSRLSEDITTEQGVASGSGSKASAAEHTSESDWEYVEAPIDDPAGDGEPQTTQYQRRMEVIARFPTHSLKELDDLWRKVHLGAVVRVFGDIEISEKKKMTASMTNRWSALLHCLDFEILELWRGKDAFEPNPGSAEISNGVTTEQNAAAGGGKASGKKRKSSEMSEDSSASQQQQRGDDSQPHCKFWLNSGKCSKEVCEFWHETDPVKLKAERRRWVDEVSVALFVSDCRGCQRDLFIGGVVLIDNGNLFHTTIANPSEETNLTSCLGPAPKNDQEPTSGTSTILCKVADRHVHTPVLERRLWSA